MNPDDLLELLKAATIGLRGDPNRPNPRGLPQAELAKIRLGIKKARADGVSDEELNSYLTQNYGRSLADLTTPTRRDYARAAVPFADEIAGAVASLPLRGQLGNTPQQNYEPARDATRLNEHGAKAIAPKRMLAAEVGGMLPLAAAGPSLSGLSGGARALSAAGTGGLFGALSGFDNSEAESLGGLASDTGHGAVIGTATGLVGAGIGGLLGKGYNLVRDRFRPAAAIMQDFSPRVPQDLPQRLAHQESFVQKAITDAGEVPGGPTAAAIDYYPEVAKVVGQSREAAKSALPVLEQRISELDRARNLVGKRYDPFLKDHAEMVVDDELRAVIGDRFKLGEKVSFKELKSLRSEINRRLFPAQEAMESGTPEAQMMAGPIVGELAPVKNRLNQWLHSRISGLDAVDKDYAAVRQMLSRAQQVRKFADASQKNAGVARIGGNAPGSAGSALLERPSLGQALMNVLKGRGNRAATVERILMRPENTGKAMGLLAADMSPADDLLSRSLLFGASAQVPSLIGQ